MIAIYNYTSKTVTFQERECFLRKQVLNNVLRLIMTIVASLYIMLSNMMHNVFDSRATKTMQSNHRPEIAG